MTYSPEDTQAILTTADGKSYIIDGFASDDLEIEQSWHRLCEVKEDGAHIVNCLDSDFKSYIVSFTEAGYNEHIKDLKPSVKSPFCFKENGL